MKILLLTAAVALAVAFSSAGSAQAKGCIKGALVGGLAGHVVHHGLVGAAGGCIVGHHMAAKHQREMDEQRRAAQEQH